MRCKFRLCFGIILFFIFSSLLFPAGSIRASEPSDSPISESSDKINQKAIEKLRAMTPEEIKALDEKLAEAMTLYYDRKFGQALTIFKEIAGEVETMDVMWWLGTSAMNAGEIQLAIGKFKRMLEIDPQLHRVRLELAMSYFKLGKYDEARREIEIVRAAEPPEAVVKNMEKLLAAIDRETKKLFCNVRFSQGVMYDTNVSAGPNEQELKVSGGTLSLDTDSKKIRDEALVTSLQGNVLYDFGQKQSFMWNTEVMFYNSAYQTHSKYNFMMVDINTGPWWVGRRDIVKVPVGYREQYYGSERLSNIIHFDPSYEHYFSQYFSLRALYSYNKEFFYSEDNSSLENNTEVYELSPSIYLGNRRHIISGALGYENRDADARRFCYSAYYYALSYFTRFPSKTELFFRYKWIEKNYKDKPLLYTEDRDPKSDIGLSGSVFWRFLLIKTSLAVRYPRCFRPAYVYITAYLLNLVL